MAGGPELFVVCKNCQEQVSPYITECPYCGHRLRKRAPKLERGGVPKQPRRRRKPATPRLGRLRPGEMPGVRTDSRPYATLVIVLASVLATLAAQAAAFNPFDAVVGPEDDPWRAVTALFIYGLPFFDGGTSYELVALSVIFLFGWLLERRHGRWAPVLVFLAGGVAGMALVQAIEPNIVASGGNGAALALVAAWAMRDILARRRGEETESDLLGVLVITVVLIMIPAAAEEAHTLATAGGGIVGMALGVPLARLPER